MALRQDVANITLAVQNIVGYDEGTVSKALKRRVFDKIWNNIRHIVTGLNEQTDRTDRPDSAVQTEIDDAASGIDDADAR